MLVEDFSIETVEVGGYPIQTFKARFRNIWGMLLESAARYPDEVYLIENEQRLTFGQTVDLAGALASYIKKQAGFGRGDHLGILMENSIRFVVTFWAIQNLGATAVVFNTRLAKAELKRQLQFSDLKALIYSPLLASGLQETSTSLTGFVRIELNDKGLTGLPKKEELPLPNEISEDDKGSA